MKSTTKSALPRRLGLQTVKGTWQRLSVSLMLLMLTTATAWAKSPNGLLGSGTASDPFQISTAQEWRKFAELINYNSYNSTYADKYYKLTADITISGEITPSGDDGAIYLVGQTLGTSFRGHFDGDGKTLTFNFTTTYSHIAPFEYVDGATIENLNVAGSLSTNITSYNAGLVACSSGNTTITNCTSSIAIHSFGNNSGCHSGLVACVSEGSILTITRSTFNGSITGSFNFGCGCFVGDNLGTVNITDCLSAPSSTNEHYVYPFIKYWGGSSTLTRAYYTGYNGDFLGQGIHVYTNSPVSPMTKKIQIFNGNYYWQKGTAVITGLNANYALQGSSIALPTCGVTFDGLTLSSTDYDVSVKNSNDQTVNSITAAGIYTLTATGKGNYGGSVSKTFEVYTGASVPYIDANGATQHSTFATRLESATLPQGDWWYVTNETNISGRIEISGTKHIILCDGATLNVSNGIHLTGSNSLTIYGQSEGTGQLVINLRGKSDYMAGIGGNNGEDCGTLIINGGDIDVEGGTRAAGIGGGNSGSGGTITINGGKVTARTDTEHPHGGGSAIGGGGTNANTIDGSQGGAGGTITINGGIVSATASSNDAWICNGIGGGLNNNNGIVTINWKNASDRVFASSYRGTINVSGDFVLANTHTKATSSNIGAQTIIPAKAVTIGSVSHGSIALSGSLASGSLFAIGSNVTVDVAADPNYIISGASYNDGSDHIIKYTGNEYSFMMPAKDVTVSATFAINPADFSQSGDEYTIHTPGGWSVFCDLLAENSKGYFSGKTVNLGSDISVTRMAGSNMHEFTGVFDGNGKTLTFNSGSSDNRSISDEIAPFSYVGQDKNDATKFATFRNLTIAGTLYTQHYGSAFVGIATGRVDISGCEVNATIDISDGRYASGFVCSPISGCQVNISNCVSNVTIISSVVGNRRSSGFIGSLTNGTVNITNSVFTGSLLGSSTMACSGFVGSNSGTVNITDCLFAPASITMDASGASTFVHNDGGTVNITNSYYTQTHGTEQGIKADYLLSETSTVPTDMTDNAIVVFRREFTSGKASTIVLPFDYTPAASEGTYYTFAGIEKVNGEYVATMAAANTAVAPLKANTPYVFMPAGTDGHKPVLYHGTAAYDVSGGLSATNGNGDWTFHGTYQLLTYGSNLTGYVYGFASKAKDVENEGHVDYIEAGEFVHAKSGASVPPMRCYLTYNKNNGEFAGTRGDNDLPQTITVRFVGARGEVTAIGTLNTQTGEIVTDGWYTLSGTKLSGKPTKRGIYINNGRKVVLH